MNIEGFSPFTDQLTERLHCDPNVVGLVLLGSCAGTHHLPDCHSDHDFFVIVSPGHEQEYRSRLDWLPGHSFPVVHFYRDTLHGARVIYADGHLLEYAVFTPDELSISRNHHARIVFDKQGDLSRRLAPTLRAPPVKVDGVISDFYLHLLVGLGRHARGELLAGRQQVNRMAEDILRLLHALHPPLEPTQVDDRNPWRRVEKTHPAEAALILHAVQQPTPEAAVQLLHLARRLAGNHPAWNEAVIRSLPQLENIHSSITLETQS